MAGNREGVVAFAEAEEEVFTTVVIAAVEIGAVDSMIGAEDSTIEAADSVVDALLEALLEAHLEVAERPEEPREAPVDLVGVAVPEVRALEEELEALKEEERFSSNLIQGLPEFL